MYENNDHLSREIAWSEEELLYLQNASGKLSTSELSAALNKSTASIEQTAEAAGISLVRASSDLVWCTNCATWRTKLNTRTGWCRVCTMREQLKNREDACADALALMEPADRAVYEDTEVERQTRHLPPLPTKRFIETSENDEPAEEEARYLADLEEWQYHMLKLRYDAVKTRLRRMREKTGTNPRK